MSTPRQIYVLHVFGAGQNGIVIVTTSKAKLKNAIKAYIKGKRLSYPNPYSIHHKPTTQLKQLNEDWKEYSIEEISEHLINGYIRIYEDGKVIPSEDTSNL